MKRVKFNKMDFSKPCRMLQPGQKVVISGLAPGFNGKIGTVVGLCHHSDLPMAAIVPAGYWTVAFEDRFNGGVLHRDIQRNYLRRAKAGRVA